MDDQPEGTGRPERPLRLGELFRKWYALKREIAKVEREMRKREKEMKRHG